jgi:magnesium chelatase family protein
MFSTIFSGTIIGVEGVLIEVEVDVAERGFPSVSIVGLPNKSIDEAKDRVRTALMNNFFEMPDSRITINLAPADIPKIGSGFDLPIALGILASSGRINNNCLKNSLFIGELSLDGEVKPVPGVISIILMAQRKGIQQVFIPYENRKEAMYAEETVVYPVKKLSEIVTHLNGKYSLKQLQKDFSHIQKSSFFEVDLSEINGQEQAKRALIISAAGCHNIHLKGVPGVGKTMLSKTFPSLLTDLTKAEMVEVSKIYSAAGLLENHKLISNRPFRAPHHTISKNALIGGGTVPVPGEISLAHRGVLFLDEFPEFGRSTLDSLRQPMEDGYISISRTSGTVKFPSQFLLIAASNPCPCGYYGHPTKQCTCSPGSVLNYRKRISGPLLDRIDLHVDVLSIEHADLIAHNNQKLTSEQARKHILKADEIQKKRFSGSHIRNNNEMRSADIKKFCSIDVQAQKVLEQAIERLTLSARSYFKLIKVSQTIADLEQSNVIKSDHVLEALQFRNIE